MRAYERLLRYARVYTTSDPASGTHPSSERQFDLARLLVDEMKEMGIEDAAVDEHCYVYGTIPATPGCEGRPALGLIAHMDTAPDAPGENVQPVIHENYDGKDVVLPGTGAVLKVSTFPFLASMKGETLITSDGTTLLGADDKSGVAEILTAAETVLREGTPHGKLCIAFTPDEEIGEGADLFDIPRFGADFAYTVDGGDVGGIEYENFNAASATVTIRGLSVHPGSAKNTMINASNVAMEFHMALPLMARPETTEGRQGFYHLCQMYGDVNEAKLGYILRDHDAACLEYKKSELLQIAAWLNSRYGAGTVTVEIKDGYRKHRHRRDQGRLPQYDRENQAPFPSGGDRPHRHSDGRSGPRGNPGPRRHRRRCPELEGPALPQPGHRRLQFPRGLRVHHRRADGQGHRGSAQHHRPLFQLYQVKNSAPRACQPQERGAFAGRFPVCFLSGWDCSFCVSSRNLVLNPVKIWYTKTKLCGARRLYGGERKASP